jgi:hypothetical protein
MSGVAVQKQQEEWWTRERAAAFLGIDVRKLRKLAQGGRIRRQHVPPGPGRPYQAVLYLATDVIAYKAEAAAGDASTGVPHVRPVEAPAGALTVAIGLLAERLAPPARVRRWLTLDEAVEYSGLPRAYLLRMARHVENDIAMNVGTEARPRWRFDRDKL